MNHKVNTQEATAVATDYYWLPLDQNTPRGVKLQLLNIGGVAVYGNYNGVTTTGFTHWAPLPRKVAKK